MKYVLLLLHQDLIIQQYLNGPKIVNEVETFTVENDLLFHVPMSKTIFKLNHSYDSTITVHVFINMLYVLKIMTQMVQIYRDLTLTVQSS